MITSWGTFFWLHQATQLWCWGEQLSLFYDIWLIEHNHSQPALAANSSSLLIILRDTFSWRAHLLISQSCMFISGSSLAFFLPPPGSLTLLLYSLDRLCSSILFFRQSLTLLGPTEKRLLAASPEFSFAYFMTESLNFKSYFLFFCCTRVMVIINLILTARKQAQASDGAERSLSSSRTSGNCLWYGWAKTWPLGKHPH